MDQKLVVTPTHCIVSKSGKGSTLKFTLDDGLAVYLGDEVGMETNQYTHVHIREENNGANGIGINLNLLNSLIVALTRIKRKIYSE